MKFADAFFKDVPCIKLLGSSFEATFLPYNGGKLVSLKYNGTEWLAQDKNPVYLPQSADGVYVDSEVSGADEMFPTIDPCTVNGKNYPCHGEVCRASHTYRIDEDTLIIEYTSKRLDYHYKKTISENSDGSLNIKYEIKNLSDSNLPCIWAFHTMFAAQKGGKVFAAFPKNAVAEIMFDDRNRFGVAGDMVALNAELLTSLEYKKDGDAYKYYIDKPLEKGVCGYYRNNEKCGIALCYDVSKLPYLGVWINDGGFKDMYSATVEPCNIPFDSPTNAKKHGFEFIISPKAVFEFEIDLCVVDEIF